MDLFLRAFQGREDVHARRRPGGAWRPVPGRPDRDAVTRHCEGLEDLGILPLLPDGTTRVLALDPEAPEDTERAARARGLPYLRTGPTLWFLFDPPVRAARARALARLLAHDARTGPSPAALRGEDPVLLPRTPVSLPARMDPDDLEGALAEREAFRYGPLPLARRRPLPPPPARIDAPVQVVLGTHIEVPDPGCPAAVETFLRAAVTLPDPRRGERRIRCGGRAGAGFVAPRGLWERLREFLDLRRLPWTLEDRRPAGRPRALRTVRLEPAESRALEEALRREACVLLGADPLPTALAVVARRGLPTLVLSQRLETWLEALERVVGVPRESVGVIAGGQARLGSLLTVASPAALAGRDLEDLGRYFGQVVVDECHRLALGTLVHAVRQLPARYLLGLATRPRRPDGLHRVVYAWLGEVVGTGPGRPRTRLDLRVLTSADDDGPGWPDLEREVAAWTAAGGAAWILAPRIHPRVEGAVVGPLRRLGSRPLPEAPVALFVVDPPTRMGAFAALVGRVQVVVDRADLRTLASDREARRRRALYARVLGEGAVPDLPPPPRQHLRGRKRESGDQMLLPLD